MKIIHTSDWHIGKIVNERSFLDDQKLVLNRFIDEVKEIRPDLVIIAGDIYDRFLPSRDSVDLLDELLARMMGEWDWPVCIISGNHDAGERIAYGREAFSRQGIYLSGQAKREVDKVSVGLADVWLLPFADYAVIRELYEDDSIRNLAQSCARQIQAIHEVWDPSRLNIIVYHGYVTNIDLELDGEEAGQDLDLSDSERPLSIGTTEYVPLSVFEGFDYAALGHLHGAQRVGPGWARYSGSPLKYSKSEARQKKQYLEVDLTKDSLEVTSHPFKPVHDLRVLRGHFDDLMAGESEDYVYFELTDSVPVHEGMSRLRSRYPNAMSLEYVNLQKISAQESRRDRESLKKTDPLDLFRDFYRETLKEDLTDYQEAQVKEALKSAKEASQ